MYCLNCSVPLLWESERSNRLYHWFYRGTSTQCLLPVNRTAFLNLQEEILCHCAESDTRLYHRAERGNGLCHCVERGTSLYLCSARCWSVNRWGWGVSPIPRWRATTRYPAHPGGAESAQPKVSYSFSWLRCWLLELESSFTSRDHVTWRVSLTWGRCRRRLGGHRRKWSVSVAGWRRTATHASVSSLLCKLRLVMWQHRSEFNKGRGMYCHVWWSI